MFIAENPAVARVFLDHADIEKGKVLNRNDCHGARLNKDLTSEKIKRIQMTIDFRALKLLLQNSRHAIQQGKRRYRERYSSLVWSHKMALGEPNCAYAHHGCEAMASH